MRWEHVVKSGTLVNAYDVFEANIYIKDGKIAAVTGEDLGEAEETTDARGKYVLPGFIDTHVHSRDGFLGAHEKEDFFHSSRAGAASGFTTVYEMPNCNPAVYNAERLNELIKCITPKAHTDFGVWGLCLGKLNNHELRAMAEAGVVGFKFFWGYAIDARDYQLVYNYREGMENVLPPPDLGEIYQIFREVAKTGKPLGIHAENFDIIRLLTKEVMESGDTSYAALLRSRPPFTETTVIETAISLAKELKTRLHILHLAAGDGVELIRAAKGRGISVTAETCPHYLAFTDEEAEELGAVVKGYPPVRTRYDQEKLWEGLLDGTLSLVCSDHAPHTEAEKRRGFFEAPAGGATIETMSLFMLDAVNRGRLSLQKLVEVLSEQPARMFHTYPQKGSLLPGADADIVVVDMDEEYVFHQERMHSRVKLSAYDKRVFRGRPVKTILRGHTMAENGNIVSGPYGRFLRAGKA